MMASLMSLPLISIRAWTTVPVKVASSPSSLPKLTMSLSSHSSRFAAAFLRLACPRHLACGRGHQRIEELLGRHRLEEHAGEEEFVLAVVFSARRWSRSSLDRPYAWLLQIQRIRSFGIMVVLLGPILGEVVEQFGIGDRVVFAEVVGRVLGEALAEEVAPHAVDERLGEVGAVGDELGQLLRRVLPVGIVLDAACRRGRCMRCRGGRRCGVRKGTSPLSL